MVMVRTGELSEPDTAVFRFCAPRIVRLQGDRRARNRIEKLSVTGRSCKLIRLRSVAAGEGRNRRGCAEQGSYLFVHECLPKGLFNLRLPSNRQRLAARLVGRPNGKQQRPYDAGLPGGYTTLTSLSSLVCFLLILLLSPVLIRFVMPDCASHRSADCSMMPSEMSRHPANSRALGTALGVGWYHRQRDENRQSAGQ